MNTTAQPASRLMPSALKSLRRGTMALLLPLLLLLLGCGPQSTPTPTTAPAAQLPPTVTPTIVPVTQVPPTPSLLPPTSTAQPTSAVEATSTPLLPSAPTDTLEPGMTREPTTVAGQTPQATEAAQVSATAEPAATATIVVPPGDFLNPVIKSDFPDPGVLFVNDTYYAYATNSAGKNVQVAKSTDLVNWTMLRDGLPAPGKWASTAFGNVWAPEVISMTDHYLMYYVARVRDTSAQCIGVATSTNPEGPYRDSSDKPLVCQLEQGGSIDPDPYREGDKLYLYWKNDGNCCGSTTYIYAQELAPDGMSLVGEPKQLVSNDKRWEGPVVEAPTMWKQDGHYFLFFSGNAYNSINYAVGYATCDSPTGPCMEAPENPILQSKKGRPPALGPGHQTVVLDKHGHTWLVYHVWAVPVSGQLDKRQMWLDQLTWEDGKPHVHGPTTDPQPEPEP